jgi:hypothetical protein
MKWKLGLKYCLRKSHKRLAQETGVSGRNEKADTKLFYVWILLNNSCALNNSYVI